MSDKHLTNWGKKTRNIGEHKVVYVSENIVDCFFYNGFQNHTRIHINRYKKSFRFTNSKDGHSSRLHYLVRSILGEIK